MRRALPSGLVVALLFSFSRAPHDHFHPSDPLHHHTHESCVHEDDHHPLDGPEWEAPDHDSTAQFKDWLAGDGTTTAKHVAEQTQLSSVAALKVIETSLAFLTIRNHDPPARTSQPARAPPSTSCL